MWWIIVSGFSGWIAGQIMKGHGYGILWNILMGIFGGWAGNFIFNTLGISIASGTLGTIITSVIGAVAITFVSGIIAGKR